MNKIKLKIYLTFRIIIVFILIQFSKEIKSQDTHFSQFYNTPLAINPALTGDFNGNLRILTSFRNQWSSISSNPYETFSASGDKIILKKNKIDNYLAIGLYFLSDKAGVAQFSLNQINLSISYHANLSIHNVISAGIQSGFAQQSINFDKIKWDNQYDGSKYDPNLPSLEPFHNYSLSYFDFATGLQWCYKKGEKYISANNELNIKAGIAVFHVNQPNISFYSLKDKIPMKLILNGSAQIGISGTKASLDPYLVYAQQGPLKYIVLGAMVREKLVQESVYTGNIKGASVSLGCLYRVGDALIPALYIEMESYAIGFSYDVNASRLTKATNTVGGFELSLRFINF